MDDLELPLTPSHLVMGYRVLSLPDPCIEIGDTDYNQSAEDLMHTMTYLVKITKEFWRRWKREYLTELRESHRASTTRGGASIEVKVGEVVTIYDEGQPRGLWRLGRVEEIFETADVASRGARVRV